MVLEVLEQVWDALLNKHVQDVVVNHNADHLTIIVYGYEALEELRQHPKRLFFAHNAEESANNKIESLAVAYFRVSHRVGRANTSQRIDDILIGVKLLAGKRSG